MCCGWDTSAADHALYLREKWTGKAISCALDWMHISKIWCTVVRLFLAIGIGCVCTLGCAPGLAIARSAQRPPPPPALHPSVPLAELRCGQYNVGVDVVEATIEQPLRDAWNGAGGGEAGRNAVDALLRRKAVPVVIGPNGQLHLVDGHHHATAIHRVATDPAYGPQFPDYVYVYVIDDLSAYSGQEFWTKMLEGGPVRNEDCEKIGTLHHQYLWPYDRGVLQDPSVNPPPTVPHLTDDVLRSISEWARIAKGYRDVEDWETHHRKYLFFLEFFFANYLRDLVYLQGENWEHRGGNAKAKHIFKIESGETAQDATERLVATAALSCRDPGALKLPGWTWAADVNADGRVDGDDFALLLSAWDTGVSSRYRMPTSDINQNGHIGVNDIAQVIEKWGLGTDK